MTNKTKERLLNDLETLRSSLAELEASHEDGDVPDDAIPTLIPDNIPVLGDAVPAGKEDAIQAHREAMAKLDAELREIDATDDKKAAHHGSVNMASKEAGTKALAAEEHTVDKTTNHKDATMVSSAHLAAVAQSISAGDMAHSASNIEPPAYQRSLVADSITIMDTLKSLSHESPALKQSEDNPFLPQHLRERLNKSKSSLLEEIARSSESIDASTALLQHVRNPDAERPYGHQSHTTDATQALVDLLVAKYLPIIEAELRQRLISSLQKAETADIA